MDLKQGLLCGLTGEKAAFEDECPDFNKDETVVEVPLDDQEGLQSEEIAQKLEPELVEKIKAEQKLVPGVIAGVIVGILGAILWAMITVATEYQIGYMALAIGAGVGLAIRNVGNGIDPIFGYWGAGIALFSVLLGNCLGIIGFVANIEGLDYMEALVRFDYSYLPELLGETFGVIDLVFYGIAIYEGYKFSFRVITEKDLMELRQANK